VLGEERDELPALAVQGAAFEEVVKLYLLKATRRVEALLVARRHVLGGLFAFSPCFCAL
jgi:hypothetical protein